MAGRLDIYSETWVFVSQWAANEIERVRLKNDSTKNSAEETMALRGEIKALKNMLALADPPKERLRQFLEPNY